MLATVHDVTVCGDEGAFGDEYGGAAAGAAARGEHGVLKGLPGVCRDQGKEAEGWKGRKHFLERWFLDEEGIEGEARENLTFVNDPAEVSHAF